MGNKKHKKVVNTIKPKPYTVKQENDIVLGKIIIWCFLLSLPFTGLLGVVISWNIKVLLLVWGTLCLLFAIYNLLGFIFKWDHARVCAKTWMKKKYDIRNDWNKEDSKGSISAAIIWSIFGVILLIGSIFH